MKRLLSILFVLTGMICAQSAFSQTSKPTDKKASKKADTTAVAPDAQKASGPGGNQSGGGAITIDESGAPKVKAKPSATTTVPNNGGTPPKEEAQKKDNDAAQKASADDAPDAPSPIAIDESGSVKVKKAPAATNNNPGNSDSTAVAPRPQF